MSKKKSSEKSKSPKRPKQEEIPLKGEGVETVTDEKLTALADTFIELRDGKAALAEKMTATENQILTRMDELGITLFRFSDQEMKAKTGARHVKVKTVRVETGETVHIEGAAPVDTTEGEA